MKWPFVRRSKYESMISERDEQKQYKEWWEDNANNLLQHNTSNIVEINRLNQELANELNSHRETKKQNQQRLDAYNTLNHKYRCLVKELEETKDALKIAIDDLKNAALCIGEQKTQLEIWKKRSNFYSNNCTEAKDEMSKVRGYLKTIAKKL